MASAQLNPIEHKLSPIQRLVQNARRQGEPDGVLGKRQFPRFTTGMRLEVTTNPDLPDEAASVIMHNVSEGGFAFWAKREYRSRTPLWVREFDADDPEWVSAKVCHCTRGILGFLVGAQFDTPAIGATSLAIGHEARHMEQPPREQNRPTSAQIRKRIRR